MREPLDPELAELKSKHYRWWTVYGWWNEYDFGFGGVKLGPLTVAWYRWFDDRWRVGVSLGFGPEHIVFGGPLR